MAGTRGLLCIAICSMTLPTLSRAPGPGRLTLSPRRVTCASPARLEALDSPSPQGGWWATRDVLGGAASVRGPGGDAAGQAAAAKGGRYPPDCPAGVGW